MNLRKTLLLGLTLGVVALLIFYKELPISVQLSAALLLPHLDPQLVRYIEIDNGKDKYRLKRADLGTKYSYDPEFTYRWLFDQPTYMAAERGIIDDLLTRLVKLKHHGEIPSEEREADLAVYGLDKPEALLVLTAGAQTTNLQFGKFNSYANGRYVLRNGELLLADDGVLEILKSGTREIRDKTPIEFIDPEVSSIILEGTSHKMRFELHDGMQWLLTEPVESPTEVEEMISLNRTLRAINAVEILDEGQLSSVEREFAKHALLDPSLSVQIEFDPGLVRKTLRFKVAVAKLDSDSEQGEEELDEEYYMQVEDDPAIYVLSQNPSAAVLKPIEEFRKRKFLNFDPESVSEIIVESPAGVIHFKVHKDETWSVNDKAVDPPFFAQYIKELALFKISGFVSSSVDSGLDSPQLSIKIKAKSMLGKPQEWELKVGHKVEDKYFASITGAREIVTIDEAGFKMLAVKEERFLPVNN